MLSKTILCIAAALLSVSADYSCKLTPKDSSKEPREIEMNYDASETGCRSLGEAHYHHAEFDAEKVKMEFYNDYGCSGEPAVVKEESGPVKHVHKHRSCRIVPKDVQPVTYDMPSNLTESAAPTNASCFFDKPPVAAPPSLAAILFDNPNYDTSAEEHWIDGQMDECRGLSGNLIGSVKQVATVGADASSPALDGYTLAFYSGYACTGVLLASVTGSQPQLCDQMSTNWKDSGCPSIDTPSNSTTPASVSNSTVPAPVVDSPVAAEATNASMYGNANAAAPLYKRHNGEDHSAEGAAPVVEGAAPVVEGAAPAADAAAAVVPSVAPVSPITPVTSAAPAMSSVSTDGMPVSTEAAGHDAGKAEPKCFRPLSVKFVKTGVPSSKYGATFDVNSIDESDARKAAKGMLGAMGVVGMAGLVQWLV